MLGPSKTPRKALEAILAALENSTRAGCRVTKPRPFVVDRNICHFMWYSGGASEGLRSVGEEALPSSKSMCSILPIARLLRAGVLRAPALTLSWRRCRHSKRRRWKGAWWVHWLVSSRDGLNRSDLRRMAARSLRRFYGRGPSGLGPFAWPHPKRLSTPSTSLGPIGAGLCPIRSTPVGLCRSATCPPPAKEPRGLSH
jgi:hypothetical protein